VTACKSISDFLVLEYALEAGQMAMDFQPAMLLAEAPVPLGSSPTWSDIAL